MAIKQILIFISIMLLNPVFNYTIRIPNSNYLNQYQSTVDQPKTYPESPNSPQQNPPNYTPQNNASPSNSSDENVLPEGETNPDFFEQESHFNESNLDHGNHTHELNETEGNNTYQEGWNNTESNHSIAQKDEEKNNSEPEYIPIYDPSWYTSYENTEPNTQPSNPSGSFHQNQSANQVSSEGTSSQDYVDPLLSDYQNNAGGTVEIEDPNYDPSDNTRVPIYPTEPYNSFYQT